MPSVPPQRDPLETTAPYLRLVTGDPQRWQAHAPPDWQESVPAEPGDDAIRVLLAVGESLVTAGYRTLLERGGGIEVVGEAASVPEAVELASETASIVVLLDERLAGLEDPETTTTAVSCLSSSGVAVLLIAGPATQEDVVSAVRAGAVAVLSGTHDPAALICAVRFAAQGQALLPVDAMRRLMDEVIPRPRHEDLHRQMQELTDRELEVVALVASGLTNREIAGRLVISPRTAKTHVSHAMRKVGAHHRAQLVVAAYEHGLVTAQPEATRGAGGETAEGYGPGVGRPPASARPHGS